MAERDKKTASGGGCGGCFLFVIAFFFFVGLATENKPRRGSSGYSQSHSHSTTHAPATPLPPLPDLAKFDETSVHPEDSNLATNIIIIFDNSGSMADGDRIGRARSAMDAYLASLNPHANVGLISFDGFGGPMIMEPLKFTESHSLREKVQSKHRSRSKIRSLKPNGATPLNLCLEMARDILFPRLQQAPYERNIVILVTDGADTVTGKESVGRSMQELTTAGVEVNLIAFETSENSYLRPFGLRYFEPTNTQELTAALNETLSEANAFTNYSATR